MENVPMIVMSAPKVELLSSKEDKYIIVPRIIHIYEEWVFIGERIIEWKPLRFYGEINDEFYRDKSFLDFRGRKL